MQIVERNPTLFVQVVASAIADGWKVSTKNEGVVTEFPLFSVQLFKGHGYTVEVELNTDKEAVISEYDSMVFLSQLQQAVMNGFILDVESVQWDVTGKKVARLTNPNYIKFRKYTKDELENLQWEDLKKVMLHYDIRGKQRSVIVAKILNMQEK